MKTRIKELVKTQELCCVYTNSEATDKFAVGFILQQDDNYFLMESIDQYGKSDGVFCSLVENVIKIEKNSEYASCIQKLFSYFKQTRYSKPHIQSDILKGLIEYAQLNNKICTIELCNSGMDDTVGFIKEFDKEIIEVEIINQYGKKDGIQTVNLSDISHLTCDSIEEQKIEILFDINN